MLMKTLFETYREVTRPILPGQGVTTGEVQRDAANPSRWINE